MAVQLLSVWCVENNTNLKKICIKLLTLEELNSTQPEVMDLGLNNSYVHINMSH